MDFLWISSTLLKWYLPLPLALPLSPTNDRLPNIKPFKYHWLFVELMSHYWLLHYFIYLFDKYIFHPCFDYAVNKYPPPFPL